MAIIVRLDDFSPVTSSYFIDQNWTQEPVQLSEGQEAKPTMSPERRRNRNICGYKKGLHGKNEVREKRRKGEKENKRKKRARRG